MARTVIIAIVAIFTLGLVGCAPGGQIEPAPEASSTEGAPDEGAPGESFPDEESSSEPDSGDLAKAGSEKVRTDDGLEIWITDLKRGRIGSNASGGHPGDPMVLFRLHIKNGTTHKVNGDEFSVSLSYGAEGDEAEGVYDTGLDSVTGVIARGRQKTGKYGFAVPTKHMNDLIIQVDDYEHEPALFAGAVK